MKKRIIFALFSLLLVITLTSSMGASNMVDDNNSLSQLDENKLFITETFDAIGENPQVMLSSTVDIAKTAEPELYNAMLSQGDALLPAVLSLLEESAHGRRGAELYMLYQDIQESLGQPVLDYEQLASPLPEDTAEDTSVSVYTRRMAVETKEPTYVWWVAVDPSIHIPEPDNTENPPPDYIRWEPMLGAYIYRDAYYIEELSMIVLEEFPQDLTPQSIRITLAVQPKGAGSVTASSEEALADESITLTQEAAEGYRFSGWTATDGTFEDESSASTTFIVPASDVTITANFLPVDELENDGTMMTEDKTTEDETNLPE